MKLFKSRKLTDFWWVKQKTSAKDEVASHSPPSVRKVQVSPDRAGGQ